jgi:hypothetical protein
VSDKQKCYNCFSIVEEPIYNMIFKIGPDDNTATGNLSFECEGEPVGVCEDCLFEILKERVQDWHI